MELSQRHEFGTKIEEFKVRIREIKERSERYQLRSSIQGSSSNVSRNHTRTDFRVASLYMEEDQIVGIGKPRDELVRWLVEGESRRLVFAVVGMGGLGKTTLVKKVFDDEKVTTHFEFRAWVTVSKSFAVQDLLRAMLKQFCEARKESQIDRMDTMEQIDLIDKAREFLRHKKFVVIFDDVWNMDPWNSIQHALPCNNCGSRIMLTTRNHEVASYCVESLSHVYNLKPLPFGDSWKLFCMKAFREHNCPLGLEELSHKIVKRCEGMPLAIVTIGGLFSRKTQSAFELQKLHDSIGHELETNIMLTPMTRILSLSYNDLPFHLKSCFLYLGIFPENYIIKCGRLIRLWIAEGFVKEARGKSLEDVAESYLRELIQRNMLQAMELYHDGRVRSCRVHDLLREISISKSEEERFCKVTIKQDLYFVHQSPRRVSVHHSCGDVSNWKKTDVSHLRSLFMFGVENLKKGNCVHRLLGDLKLLKVLDLQDAPLESFPDEIVSLFHLRYLSLKNTKIRVLPNSLSNLRNLLVLDLRNTFVNKLPVHTVKLRHLRHLFAYSFHRIGLQGVMMNKGIGQLTALQKLEVIEADEDGTRIVRELGNLTKLRNLGITKLRRQHGKGLCASLEKMNDLRTLRAISIHEDELLDLHSMSSPPLMLQLLWLVGRLERLPSWITSLHSLVYIGLQSSMLRDDPIRVLQTMPNLMKLFLSRTSDAEDLYFEANGFRKLKELDICNFDRLNSVTVAKGAMPVLEELVIRSCGQLKILPSGIEHLTNLKDLNLIDMPEQLERMILCPNDVEHEHKRVKHIPNIYFTALCEGRRVTYTNEEFRRTMDQFLVESNINASISCKHLFRITRQTLLNDQCNWFCDCPKGMEGTRSHKISVSTIPR
nr:TPA_asm: hypothetical protein HUJ06_026435 [Nelumbo nucifera]